MDSQFHQRQSFDDISRRSPDLDPGIRCEVELFVRLDVEGCVPGVEVADGVGAVFVG